MNKEKFITYLLCAIFILITWLGVCFILAVTYERIMYWPFLILLVFVYPPVCKLIKKQVHNHFAKND